MADDARRLLSPEAWRRVFPWIAAVLGLVTLGLYAFAVRAVLLYAHRLDPADARGQFAGVVVFGLVSVPWLVVAIDVGVSRPQVYVARLCFYTFFVAGVEFLLGALDPVRPFFAYEWERVVVGCMAAPAPLAFAVAYHFFLRFPTGERQTRGWEVAKYVFYVAAVAFVIPNVVVYTRLPATGRFGVDFAYDNAEIFPGYFVLYRGVIVVSLVAGVAALARRYWCGPDPDARRRLKWVALGSAVSLLPYALLQAADFVAVAVRGEGLIADPDFYPYTLAVISLLGLIPITFGVTILRHHVFDVDVAAKLGAKYFFTKGVLEALLALPIAVHVVRILTHPNMTVGQLLYGSPVTIGLIVLAAVSLRLRPRLRAWVDRKFFRDPYDSEQILLTLVDEIKEQDSMSGLSRRVSAELESALHPRRIAILYREDDAPALTVGYSSGARADSVDDEFGLSDDATVLRMLEGETRARSLADSAADLPAEERDLLRRHGFVVAVPMTGPDRRLRGVVLLGEKRSGEEYSRRDRALLESVAAQMAIVHENTQLKSRVAREHKIRVEVLGRMDRDAVNLVKECPRCGRCYDATDEVCAVDGAELAPSLPVERVIEGKYRLDRLVGRGGMGAVYAGADLRLGREVAVKILTGQLFGDQGALRRFEREARASARLSHHNIVRVYDYGAVGAAGAFLVMELLNGRTLRAAIQHARGPLPHGEAARVTEEAFEGVVAAHAAGVIHRDLKPENVFLATDETGAEHVKLLDFGLAKMRRVDGDSVSGLTTPGTVMGTFGYMSPEQLAGADVDERTDVYALGVIAYEAAVGRKPFEATTWVDLMSATARGEVRVPGDSHEARRLELVLRRCLAPELSDRYRTAEEARRHVVPALRAFSPPPAASDPLGPDEDVEPTRLYDDSF